MPESLAMASFFSDSLDRECVRDYFLLQVKYKNHTPQQSCCDETSANDFCLAGVLLLLDEDAYNQTSK